MAALATSDGVRVAMSEGDVFGSFKGCEEAAIRNLIRMKNRANYFAAGEADRNMNISNKFPPALKFSRALVEVLSSRRR